MVRREWYEGIVDLEPSGLFGNSGSDVIRVQSTDEGYFSYEVINNILYNGDLNSPDPSDQVQFGLSIKDESFGLFGNQLIIRLIEAFPGMARVSVEAKARIFVKKLSFSLGIPITYSIRRIERVGGGRPINPIEYKCIPYVVYDRKETTKAVSNTVQELNEVAGVLSISKNYFRLGQLFMRIWGMMFSDQNMREEMYWELGDAIIGTAYLHYWKAITTITEEPNLKEYNERIFKLGLDSGSFKKTLDILRKLRNDFDIAHRNYDSTAIHEPRQFINVVKNVAQTVIGRYEELNKKTGLTFGQPRKRADTEYQERISFIEKETGLDFKSKVGFGWAISRTETPNS